MMICKTLNPGSSLSLSPFSNPLTKTPQFSFEPPKPSARKPLRITANTGKKDKTKYKNREAVAGRIARDPELMALRRDIRRKSRRMKKEYADLFYQRLKNPHSKGNYADNFSEDELQEIGLGYDRFVRFMEKDDPNLRHPHDWYKYGEYGPYTWRGLVVGEPIRGRFSDERVAMISSVRDEEEWDKIEQFKMAQKFGKRLKAMDRSKFRYFWVFVRHPRWRLSEKPWEQWTLVSEVVLEAGTQRLDKWSLMGRLGSATRSMIGKCAAWMRPDIIYVKKPVFQCRFEPQDNFFRLLMPFLDPKTEKDFMFDLDGDDVTYYGGLCRLVKVSQKAFVDDVVNAYEKLSDEKKSECLKFLLGNHPVHLLHPYTKEWKAKLEEMELGCDAPDDDEDERGPSEVVDWIEDEDEDDEEHNDDREIDDEDDSAVIEMDGADEEVEEEEEDEEVKDEKYWEGEFRKALYDSEAMEKLVQKSMVVSTERYNKQLAEMERVAELKKEAEAAMAAEAAAEAEEMEMRGKSASVSDEEWKIAGVGPWRRRIKKSKLPPELFLRGAVRLFTYRNLVKEIVLTRHAMIDGDISFDDKVL